MERKNLFACRWASNIITCNRQVRLTGSLCISPTALTANMGLERLTNNTREVYGDFLLQVLSRYFIKDSKINIDYIILRANNHKVNRK